MTTKCRLLAGLVWGVGLAGMIVLSAYNYLLFHSLIELFGVFVAAGIFLVGWSARRFHRSGYLEFIAIAYLCVAGFDVLHMLAYKGMGVFEGGGANLATQLWIAGRSLESVSLVVATTFVAREMPRRLVVGAYVAVCVALVWAILVVPVFPVCYHADNGLSFFKIVTEYVICGLLVVALVRLWHAHRSFDPLVLNRMSWAVSLSVAAELAFTLYVDVYGLVNLVGHVLKAASFFCVYRALVESGLMAPFDLVFRDLKASEDRLRQMTITDALSDLCNRRGFFVMGEKLLAAARRSNSQVLAVFADIDGLKEINDQFGHGAGDRAIRDAAGLIKSAFRKADILARIGGDEFAVLGTLGSDIDPGGVVARFEKELGEFNRTSSKPHTLRVSLGFAARAANDLESLEELLTEADHAMYRSKIGGG